MRYLGVDYGSKRIGIAISDEAGTLAFPHIVLTNSKEAVNEIAELCYLNDIDAVVVGESRNYKGEENEIMEAVRQFVAHLKIKKIEVLFEPEVLTTMQAERIQGKKDDIDSSAAALILQSFLDRKGWEKKGKTGEGDEDNKVYRQKL